MTDAYEIRVNGDGIEQVVIANADGGFTVMDKSYYEAQQAEQSTPSVTSGE
jgi:hypothetical protein